MSAGEFAVGVEDFARFFNVGGVVFFKTLRPGDINDDVSFYDNEMGGGVGHEFEALSPVFCNYIAEFQEPVTSVGPFDTECLDAHVFTDEVLDWCVDGFGSGE